VIQSDIDERSAKASVRVIVSASKLHTTRYRIAVLACVAVYAALLLPTLARYGIGWDEQTDLGVARTYLSQPGGWLRGSDVDPINVRLPMAVGAVLFAVLGGPDLLAARAISALLGALTLIAVYLFGRRELDARKGILACALLATSPYFLGYARTAFSEGDIFVTCAFAWLLVCLARLRHARTLGWATATGVVLGAALASKISAVAALPVVFLTVWIPARDESLVTEDADLRGWRGATWLACALWGTVLAGWVIGKRLGDPPALAFLAGHALAVVALWVALLATSVANGALRLGRGKLAAHTLAVGVLTFFVLPPMHTTNPDVVKQLFGAFLFSNLSSPAAFAFEAAVLHASVIAIKPGLVIGVAAWVSAITATLRVRARPALRLPLLLLGAYVLFLLRLPWAQTFYMMPALPVLMILLADQIVELFDRRRSLAVALAAIMAVSLGADLVRCYPDFHLNGYQWIGARPWGGRPSIGSRSVVPIPTDGAEQALRFVATHAAPGDLVATFVRPEHIRDAVLSNPRFLVVDGLADAQILNRADWVVTTLGSEIRNGYGADDPDDVFALPYDDDLLRRRFTKVFGVERAFGLEVAAVWRSNESRAEPRPAYSPQRIPVPPRPQ